MVNRCDAACPAEAHVEVVKPGHGLSLFFCGHCFDVRVIPLFAEGWAVREDNRVALRKAEAERR
jgi:hypothetical protein